MPPLEVLRPEWPAPACVRGLSTTRLGGASTGAYSSLNLGEHVGDSPEHVRENRRRLQQMLGSTQARWLKQVHGTHVARLDGDAVAEAADAAVTATAGEGCVVMTADCLPVLFCDRSGTRAAAAHAGWRGLAAGVLEATVTAMGAAPDTLLAWLGPAIGPQSYEVGDDVRGAFMVQGPEAAAAFRPGRMRGKWWCDLYLLARQRLAMAGVGAVYGGGYCTYAERDRFFSFRRDGECGRMATLIWLE